MADVSGNTLLMAVQAVNDAIAVLDERIRDGSGDPLDDTEMLMSHTRAAEELRSAYEVSFTENGHSLQWRERTEQGDVIYTHEPKTGFFKRMFVKFMSWLPIDWLL